MEAYGEDPELIGRVTGLARSILIEEGWKATVTPEGDLFYVQALGRLLAILAPVVTTTEIPLVLPLLEASTHDESTRYMALEVLSRTNPTEDSKPILVELLENPDLRLLAAKSLGRIGYPGALDILVDDGLKRAGLYSFMELDVESFQPYGRRGEEALLSLLGYPDSGTRNMARMLLGKLRSAEGVKAMKRDLAEALAKGDWPEAGVVMGLIAAGEDPMPRLAELRMTHPDLGDHYYILPCTEHRSYFVDSLLREEDASRAEAQAALLREGCTDQAEPILEEVRRRHANPAVRRVLSENGDR